MGMIASTKDPVAAIGAHVNTAFDTVQSVAERLIDIASVADAITAGTLDNAVAILSNVLALHDNVVTLYDLFDDRYLGDKASAPALDNDGNPLVSGAVYYNTTDKVTYVYDVSSWIVIVSPTASAAAAASALAAAASEVAALASQNAAALSETNASNSEGNASTSESNASTSASAANTSALLAQDWAAKPENILVTTGLYSALHYAAKAQASAIVTAADVIITNADAVTTNSNVLLTAADVTTTADSAVAAGEWAQHAENVLVPHGNLVDQYSAFHWAQKSQQAAIGSLTYKGGWDASGGTYPVAPDLGDFYKITVAGTIAPHVLAVSDSIIYNGTGWDKLDNTEQVTSVNSQTGAIVLNTSHISESGNLYFTSGRVTAIVTKAYIDALGINATQLGGVLATNYLRADIGDTINGKLTIGGTAASGDEGGELGFTKAPNSTMATDPFIDTYVDTLRIVSDVGGTTRVHQLDCSETSGKLYHSGNFGKTEIDLLGINAAQLNGYPSAIGVTTPFTIPVRDAAGDLTAADLVATAEFRHSAAADRVLAGTAGSVKLSNGMILKWGFATIGANGETAVIYPVAFPTFTIAADANVDGIRHGGIYDWTSARSDTTRTQVVLINWYDSTYTVRWWAIGY